MNSTLAPNNQLEQQSHLHSTLSFLFGEGVSFTKDGRGKDAMGKFIILLYEGKDEFLICVDLLSSFNKDSQCPLFFTHPKHKDLSNRRKKRIMAALNLLLLNEKEAGTFIGHLPGYEEMGEWMRRKFLFENP